ncbi:uncharacterized protein A4U43_C03F19910 [Asparagus officinalis]|uniref:Uncharacterized protein n=1 Tax=Asparagus officinalis TaxID=4686 RepID=A0A5P1FEB0_ASPOF|nr:uncharacterized protein A4U43_C03F19910 [Asparagus officinalis]
MKLFWSRDAIPRLHSWKDFFGDNDKDLIKALKRSRDLESSGFSIEDITGMVSEEELLLAFKKSPRFCEVIAEESAVTDGVHGRRSGVECFGVSSEHDRAQL